MIETIVTGEIGFSRNIQCFYKIRVKDYNGPANKFKEYNGPAPICLTQRHHGHIRGLSLAH
jgi:hypothetical protein